MVVVLATNFVARTCSAVARQKKVFFFGGGGWGNLVERAKSREYGKFLKFSFLKLLKTHLRLHGTTTMLALVGTCCVQFETCQTFRAMQTDATLLANNIQQCWELLALVASVYMGLLYIPPVQGYCLTIKNLG